MKLLVFAVCALACLTLANTKPCRGNTCSGYHYNNKRQVSDGGDYNSQVGSNAEYASTNANAVDGGTGSKDGTDSVGGADISGHSGDKEGVGTNGGEGSMSGGGNMYDFGNMFGGGGMYGGGGSYADMYGGRGKYNNYNGYRRNKYCPTCHVENIGVARPNFNTVRIRTKNQHKSSSV